MQEFNLKYKNMNAYQFRKSMPVSKTCSHLYNYCSNNPIKYIDPTGQWIENEDGSYTAEANDTLWGLSQQIGKDWRDSDYSGKPENLKIGQTIRFTKIKNLEKAKSLADYSANILVGGAQFLADSAIEGFTKATSHNLPLKVLDDLSLLQEARFIYKSGTQLGNIAFGLALVFDIWTGIDTGMRTHSFLHGLYKSGVSLASSIAGLAICTVTSPFLTPVGGIAAGICCSTLMDHFFKKLEYSIW